jgi:hypothetical protein
MGPGAARADALGTIKSVRGDSTSTVIAEGDALQGSDVPPEFLVESSKALAAYAAAFPIVAVHGAHNARAAEAAFGTDVASFGRSSRRIGARALHVGIFGLESRFFLS